MNKTHREMKIVKTGDILSTNSSMKNPQCDICKVTFGNMDIFNGNIKSVHKESDHMRMERLTQMIKAVENKESLKTKSFSCIQFVSGVSPSVCVLVN